MTNLESELQVNEGVVSATPQAFGAAVDLVRKERLRGLWIRPDFLDKQPSPPTVDLARLAEIPAIVDFGVTPDLPRKRVKSWSAIYALAKLEKLALHDYDELDLTRFPALRTLFLKDRPGCSGFESLKALEMARIWNLRRSDLSILAGARRLAELWIVQTPLEKLEALDALEALATLQLSHCAKLASTGPLPRRLKKLRIEKCGHLADLSFLAGHPSLEFFYADVVESLAFVRKLPRLSSVGFGNVVDGNLAPLVESASVREVAFHPSRKHYSHALPTLKRALAAKRRT